MSKLKHPLKACGKGDFNHGKFHLNFQNGMQADEMWEFGGLDFWWVVNEYVCIFQDSQVPCQKKHIFSLIFKGLTFFKTLAI